MLKEVKNGFTDIANQTVTKVEQAAHIIRKKQAPDQPFNLSDYRKVLLTDVKVRSHDGKFYPWKIHLLEEDISLLPSDQIPNPFSPYIVKGVLNDKGVQFYFNVIRTDITRGRQWGITEFYQIIEKHDTPDQTSVLDEHLIVKGRERYAINRDLYISAIEHRANHKLQKARELAKKLPPIEDDSPVILGDNFPPIAMRYINGKAIDAYPLESKQPGPLAKYFPQDFRNRMLSFAIRAYNKVISTDTMETIRDIRRKQKS